MLVLLLPLLLLPLSLEVLFRLLVEVVMLSIESELTMFSSCSAVITTSAAVCCCVALVGVWTFGGLTDDASWPVEEPVLIRPCFLSWRISIAAWSTLSLHAFSSSRAILSLI